MNGRVASAKSVAIDPKRTKTGLKSRSAAIHHHGSVCCPIGWVHVVGVEPLSIQNDSGLAQRLAGWPAAG
jgi:hypothetical protein